MPPPAADAAYAPLPVDNGKGDNAFSSLAIPVGAGLCVCGCVLAWLLWRRGKKRGREPAELKPVAGDWGRLGAAPHARVRQFSAHTEPVVDQKAEVSVAELDRSRPVGGAM